MFNWLQDAGGTWDPLWKPALPHNVFQNSLSWLQSKLGWSLLDSADASQCPPNWIYFTWALGLFLYQSMDAIDGKQARRTGTSGPLGEMFDHGCVCCLDVLLCLLLIGLTLAGLNFIGCCQFMFSSDNTASQCYISPRLIRR